MAGSKVAKIIKVVWKAAFMIPAPVALRVNALRQNRRVCA
ncbi:hypothetical protein J2W42_004932 [Rhizobium tibeticum]|nr:hypothetical protein [Rhizobium tibeticum]